MTRGSRMRDRVPPSHLWNSGTRAASDQPAAGDPDGVQRSLLLLELLFLLLVWQHGHGQGPLPLRWPRQSDLLPSPGISSNSSGQFVVVLGSSCSARLDPFLAMSETLASVVANVSRSHYRFSAAGGAGPELVVDRLRGTERAPRACDT